MKRKSSPTRWFALCALIGFSCGISFSALASDFTRQVERSSLHQPLKKVAIEASQAWNQLLAMYHGELPLPSERQAQQFIAHLMGLERCLSHLELQYGSTMSVKSVYLDSPQRFNDYLRASYLLSKLVGDDVSSITPLLPNITCSRSLDRQELVTLHIASHP